jgi:GNAT superfamily N-acetyltransferase
MSSSVSIRGAEPSDVPLLFSLIVELAEYERAAGEVVGSEELLARALFGPQPVAEAVVAELDGAPAGFALFYTTFSTWLCLPGIWLEDLYVKPALRRGGLGRALLAQVARVAVERGYGRLEWSALNWNTPALRFYEQLGATICGEWQIHRLQGGGLQALAGGASPDGASAALAGGGSSGEPSGAGEASGAVIEKPRRGGASP